MQALDFWKAVVRDQSDFLIDFVTLLHDHAIDYCLVGGHAVNAYVEPVVTLDLDVAVAVDDIQKLEAAASKRFSVRWFRRTLNLYAPRSDLRVQIQIDPAYSDFVKRASLREVLGMSLRVAAVEDVLQGKVWAVLDESRRPSKRQKDLADISRLIEAYPTLRERVPADVLSRLF